MLSPDDYGIWGIAFGYFGFLQLLNIGTESILWKNHISLGNDLIKALRSIEAFNIIKFFSLLMISILLGLLLSSFYNNSGFVFAMIAATAMMTTDSVVSHLATIASANYKHSIVTKINFHRVLFSLVLMCIFIYKPSLEFLMIKELSIALFVYLLWHKEKFNLLGIKFTPLFRKLSISYVWESIKTYSIWTHLCSVMTYFIYRSDTIFLSFFSGLAVVGHYNVALNLANLANILPGVLAQQNSVAISNVNSTSARNSITLTMLKISTLVGIFIFITYLLFSKIVISIIAPESPTNEIYTYLLPIVAGLLIVKSIASPIVSLININGSVYRLLTRVNGPTFIISIILYSLSSYYYGAIGLAYSNIAVSLIWLILILLEARRNDFSIKGAFNLLADIKSLKRLLIKQ